MDDITLRPAVLDDYEFVFAVKKRAMWIFPPIHTEWDENAERGFVMDKFKEPWLQIIMHSDVPIGTVGLIDQKDTFRVSQFFIEPAFHNKGIGKQVLAELLEKADTAKRDTFVRVGQHQQSAMAFYEKLGFVDTGAPLDKDNCRLFKRICKIS